MKKYIGMWLFVIQFANASVSDGPYIGIEGGIANQEVNFSNGSFNLNSNGLNLATAATAFLLRGNLGYSFNKYSALEVGSTYTFNSSIVNPAGGNFNINATTIDLSYLLSLPTSVDRLSVFGRIGFSYNWINSASEGNCTCNPNSSTTGINGSNFADVLGAGIKYRLSPSLSWRIEWIANGLLFPVGLTGNGVNASWVNQTFQTGINYSF